MKAAFYKGHRAIEIGESRVLAPGPGQVRLDVAWCGVCGTDLHIYLGHMDQRVRMPQIMGHEMSGTVAEIGPGVERWKVGDRVVVRPLDPCNDCPACRAGHSHICQRLKFLGVDTPGAFQGSWTVPAHTLHALPANVPMDIAALIEPLAVACHDVRLGEVSADEHVVVLGGGPIGILVALAAREAGAKVLVSEINPFRISFAREIGIEAVNPTEMDLQGLVEKRTGGAGADVVFEVTGIDAGAEMMTQLPRTRGRIVAVGIHSKPAPVDLFRVFWRELRLRGARVYEPVDFERAIELAASETLPLDRIATDRRPLEELAPALETIAAGGETLKTLIKTGG